VTSTFAGAGLITLLVVGAVTEGTPTCAGAGLYIPAVLFAGIDALAGAWLFTNLSTLELPCGRFPCDLSDRDWFGAAPAGMVKAKSERVSMPVLISLFNPPELFFLAVSFALPSGFFNFSAPMPSLV
jgi:hypothetical protein